MDILKLFCIFIGGFAIGRIISIIQEKFTKGTNNGKKNS